MTGKLSYSSASFTNSDPISPLSYCVLSLTSTALALIGFVGGIYYTAISKMRGSDELGKVMDREELKAKQKK